MTTENEEKRKRTRVNFKTQAILKFEGSDISTLTKLIDISMSGIYVEADEKIPKGTECKIQIIMWGGTSRLTLDLKGEVVRITETGIGISFSSIEVDSYYHLKNLIMYNAENPAEIEKEIIF